MIVVSDATALIDLIDSGCIAVLNELFEEVIIPEEVFAEVFRSRRLRQKPRWIKIRSAADPANIREFTRMRRAVDAGEAAAIAIALELDVPVIIDDKAGMIQCEIRRVTYFSLYRLLNERLTQKRCNEIISRIRERTGKLLCEPEF